MNAALREIADRRRRAAAVQRMRQMVSDGEIDFSVIEKPATSSPSAAAPTVTHKGQHAT